MSPKGFALYERMFASVAFAPDTADSCLRRPKSAKRVILAIHAPVAELVDAQG